MRRLFIDIETSPNVGYFWNPGHRISISYDNIIEERRVICVCYKWEGQDDVKALTWGKKQDDKAIITKVSKVIEKADEIIAHNGDRFDIPWLRTRALYHRIPFASRVPSVDTLKEARRSLRLNSNRLDYIAKFTGVGRKEDTGGFGLWKDVMTGSKDALDHMVSYCQQDVRVLEKVWSEMVPYIAHRHHAAVQNGGYRHECPHCAGTKTKRHGYSTTAAGTVMVRMLCLSCAKTWRMSESALLRSKEQQRKAEALSRVD